MKAVDVMLLVQELGYEYLYTHEAQTGTSYIFCNYSGIDVKIRVADHSDAHCDADVNVATKKDNLDGCFYKKDVKNALISLQNEIIAKEVEIASEIKVVSVKFNFECERRSEMTRFYYNILENEKQAVYDQNYKNSMNVVNGWKERMIELLNELRIEKKFKATKNGIELRIGGQMRKFNDFDKLKKALTK